MGTAMPLVNDVHSRLNPTTVVAVMRPTSIDELRAIVGEATRAGQALSIAGGRHAMGGQQFGSGTVLIDMGGFDGVLAFDRQQGVVEVEAGIQWPALIAWLVANQPAGTPAWGVVQKQTGADRLSIGGAVSANIHGRGLAFAPLVQDIESFVLMDASGEMRQCSRSENSRLFSLAVGGYGLFGVIVTVRLRLDRRRRLERVVTITSVDTLMAELDARRAEGFLYGDFQFMTDEKSPLFMREGVFASYRPVDDQDEETDGQRELDESAWRNLYRLAHSDRAELYRVYAGFYRSTHGQRYWSDTHQLSVYIDGYHEEIDRRSGATVPHSEMISELYVPRSALANFCLRAREELRRLRTPVIYGTVRLIERDRDSVLAWAREPWACTIFNLCVRHDPAGIAAAGEVFRALIDCALAFGGSYFPTYHRWATRTQVERCHPRLVEFLREKRKHDPDERFQSEWYRHYRTMFADQLG